ncbi:MAG TPA: hypothetical protein VM118_04925 [Acidobacteriota bacterium]|nr:hypothetical protein [Acidobacteriota bacterium]
MTDFAEMLELEIPSFGWINWDTRFDELAPHFPEWNISTRDDDPTCPDCLPGTCPRRSAVIITSGKVCGADAVTHLNFCNGKLCAVHYFFDPTAVIGSQEFYALVECLRRRVTVSMGTPGMRTVIGDQPEVSFRWSEANLHVELRACENRDRELRLAAHDPSVCPSCFPPMEQA